MNSPPPDFVLFVEIHGPGLKRFAFLLSRSEHEAEDLVQEALTKGLRRWDRLSDPANAGAYVRQIILNDHRAWLRRARHRDRAPDASPPLAVPDATAAV